MCGCALRTTNSAAKQVITISAARPPAANARPGIADHAGNDAIANNPANAKIHSEPVASRPSTVTSASTANRPTSMNARGGT